MLFTEIINLAKELNCSKTLINNLETSGLMEDAIALDEHISEMQEYITRERARTTLSLHTLVQLASNQAVKEVC